MYSQWSITNHPWLLLLQSEYSFLWNRMAQAQTNFYSAAIIRYNKCSGLALYPSSSIIIIIHQDHPPVLIVSNTNYFTQPSCTNYNNYCTLAKLSYITRQIIFATTFKSATRLTKTINTCKAWSFKWPCIYSTLDHYIALTAHKLWLGWWCKDKTGFNAKVVE